MANNEIIKRLEWLIFNFPVTENPKDETERLLNCINLYCQDAVGEINRQKAQIEGLQDEVVTKTDMLNKQKSEIVRYLHSIKLLEKDVQTAKSEAIKEFAEMYEKAVLPLLTSATLDKKDGIHACLDILKEMVGDDNA